ncbi:uncharacterized protein LOC116251245 [Nymphaea colorata]|nr:uncharacterized protein LOC116251245 [Nymphaea colorata]XP_031481261.1 uncharacterized protein LOC116251245 [Nymphaea colorata]XP_031481262.1 uncharacterized protein LOC116251245 [Nymphaea colorata]
MLGGSALQSAADIMVAGISLFVCLWVFVLVAAVLCSAAFLQNAKSVS